MSDIDRIAQAALDVANIKEGISPNANVQMELQGSKLVITIELDDVAPRLSKSGLNNLIATTGGNGPVPGVAGLKLGLNCYRPA